MGMDIKAPNSLRGRQKETPSTHLSIHPNLIFQSFFHSATDFLSLNMRGPFFHDGTAGCTTMSSSLQSQIPFFQCCCPVVLREEIQTILDDPEFCDFRLYLCVSSDFLILYRLWHENVNSFQGICALSSSRGEWMEAGPSSVPCLFRNLPSTCAVCPIVD